MRSKRKMESVIQSAISKVRYEISTLASGGSYASALASEGYAGGYQDALSDVLLLLNDVTPVRRDYWEEERER